jgi:hypothetical protein
MVGWGRYSNSSMYYLSSASVVLSIAYMHTTIPTVVNIYRVDTHSVY